MKRLKEKWNIILIVAISFVAVSCNAQKYDYTWLAGYQSSAGYYDSTVQVWGGISKFDFNQPAVVITRDSLGINFDDANSIISDTNGKPLFYTNAVQVYNFADELMENGDSLGWGPELEYYDPAFYIIGMPFPQMLIALPNPKLPGVFDLFYDFLDSTTVYYDLAFTKMLMARVDMNANGGLGRVSFKDSVVLQANENNGIVTAVKHANGRDWWLCSAINGTNCYNVMLYNGKDSIISTVQCGGENFAPEDVYSERFSPDGNTFVMASSQGPVSVFNFDRCSGILSLREEFTISEIADSLDWWPTGLEYSTDSRFFYIFCNHRIFQYDLQANPIASSKDTIAEFSGFLGPNAQLYYYAQSAPDGKIYISAGNTNYYIGVIDSPEGQGAACKFLDHSIKLPTFISGLPYYPNYRLGALVGSPCDTLTGLDNAAREVKEKIIKVFPNPSSDYVIVDYGFTDWNKGEVYLEISNALGQTVYEQVLPMHSGFQKIDISNYGSGIYIANIERQGNLVGAAKFAKE